MKTPLGLQRGEVRLVKHQAIWKKVFSDEQKILQRALEEQAISIQHVGSTAISTISAKPVVDIIVGISRLKNVQSKIPALKKLGYSHIKRFPNPRLQIVLAKGKKQQTEIYLHLVRYEGAIWNNYIFFRDYLLEHTDVALAYNKLKLQLAQKYSSERMKYTESKAIFVHNILAKSKYRN